MQSLFSLSAYWVPPLVQTSNKDKALSLNEWGGAKADLDFAVFAPRVAEIGRVRKQVKEEIGELIEAVEQNSNKIHEAADVIYHLMVYLEANNIKIEDVMSELKKRQK